MDSNEVLHRIDAGCDTDDIRADLGQMVMKCLLSAGEELGPWERVHCAMAIELLQSPWLRLTWMHADSVCNRPQWNPTRSIPRAIEDAPTIRDLTEKLKSTLHNIREHQMIALKSRQEAAHVSK